MYRSMWIVTMVGTRIFWFKIELWFLQKFKSLILAYAELISQVHHYWKDYSFLTGNYTSIIMNVMMFYYYSYLYFWTEAPIEFSGGFYRIIYHEMISFVLILLSLMVIHLKSNILLPVKTLEVCTLIITEIHLLTL